MIQRLNPDTVPKPASAYVQAVLHSAGAKRLVISGQVGITAEGKLLDGMEAQLRQCWVNLFAVMKAAGFEKRHLVKSVIYVTRAGPDRPLPPPARRGHGRPSQRLHLSRNRRPRLAGVTV
jgi:enamine deaminase RidA (YjgF/YER057c/UK114 family)